MPRRRRGMKPEHAKFLREHRHLYPELLEKQNGVCALCDRPPKNRRLDLDHDHKLMVVRGLLCVRCNRALHDWMDKEWLSRAVGYVLR